MDNKETETVSKNEEKKDSELKKKIAKLIDVKSIMTLSMTIAFIVMTLNSGSGYDQFVDIFKMIVIFYFGTQATKSNKT